MPQQIVLIAVKKHTFGWTCGFLPFMKGNLPIMHSAHTFPPTVRIKCGGGTTPRIPKKEKR